MKKIINPILKGFNPDPSIIRVENDYYIATSTFQWYPGVQIHHSRDLVNWKLVTRPLNRLTQLDMRGNPDSLGVWAPCLSYYNGTYYLVYSDVKNIKGGYMDVYNYLVTTQDILGDWSEPVYLNSRGFDQSLFHDNDGRKWLVGMSCDKEKGKDWFGGIILQEYSEQEKKLSGPVYNIFNGTEAGLTEGPHLYKCNGYYYLITAEGGTENYHCVTLARSTSLFGPYEVAPNNPIITTKLEPTYAMQKAGHADFVETPDGQVYMVHLCSRPMPRNGKCILGRETSIQKMIWTKDNWLQLECGGNKPLIEVEAPELAEFIQEKEHERDDFDNETLSIQFQTLRIPLGEDMMSLKERSGYLRLKGRESLNSLFCQSLVARRQQSFNYTASTCVEFEPDSFKQMAGLVCYYNTENYIYLRVTHNEILGKCLGIIQCHNFNVSYPLKTDVSLNGIKRIYLKVTVTYDILQFYYSVDGESWTAIGPILDAGILSDESCKESFGFTGAFVGVCCQDFSGERKYADFDYFEYIENK
ncbi:MAG: glycoside hydrolase family 43 protein [Clostridia bacterium]|nr:glycoside hydrolase family 43 protein [Clostridia bacterium]